MPDSPHPPACCVHHGDDGAWVRPTGCWSAQQLTQRAQWRSVRAQLAQAAAVAAWDLHALERLDHVGAQVLWNHWQRRWPQRLHATPGQRAMLERVAQLSVSAPAQQAQQPAWPLRLVDHLGARLLAAGDHVLAWVRLVGQLLLDGLRLLRAPQRGPWRDIGGHLYAMGASALPITALVGFLIGVVLTYLLALQLRQFGAESFIVNILGISLIRELGPLLAAILVAGRSGSAITAQIGVMRVTQELDAMQVMGIAHGFRLVLPRALALALAMPLVALWTTLAALLGGMLAAGASLGVSAAYFAQALPAAVHVGNLWMGMGKSVVFGLAIALTGCHFGLRVQPDTQSLGRGTTASVVSAITLVIVIDAVFAIVFRHVGLR